MCSFSFREVFRCFEKIIKLQRVNILQANRGYHTPVQQPQNMDCNARILTVASSHPNQNMIYGMLLTIWDFDWQCKKQYW